MVWERTEMWQTKYTSEEIRRRAEEIYRREIRPKLTPADKGKFLVVDIESGDYEMDEDDLSAAEILKARRPNGVFFGLRARYTSSYTLAGTMEEEATQGVPTQVQAPSLWASVEIKR
jgi:hypothetical protein